MYLYVYFQFALYLLQVSSGEFRNPFFFSPSFLFFTFSRVVIYSYLHDYVIRRRIIIQKMIPSSYVFKTALWYNTIVSSYDVIIEAMVPYCYFSLRQVAGVSAYATDTRNEACKCFDIRFCKLLEGRFTSTI